MDVFLTIETLSLTPESPQTDPPAAAAGPGQAVNTSRLSVWHKN